MSKVRGALPYVPCPTQDQQYAQRSVGPSPFSSAKSRNADYEQPSLTLTRGAESAGDNVVVGCKMSYPASLRSAKVGVLRPSRSLDNIFLSTTSAAAQRWMDTVNGTDDEVLFSSVEPLPNPVTQLQIPNAVWSSPPALFAKPKETHLHPEVILPRDTLHPLLSALQAGENAKAAASNPVVAYLANASRKGPPCDAHKQTSNEFSRDNAAGAAESGGAMFNPDDDDDGDAAMSLLLAKKSKQVSVRGDLRTFAGRNFSALGGFHEPERYATTVVETASTQPTTFTAMAAKALASALHDRPSHAIPANVQASIHQRLLPNSGPKGSNVNRHYASGLNCPSNPVVPPPQAFRNLSNDVKEVLLSRERDCRNKLANVLAEKHHVFQPPPCDVESGMDARAIPAHVVSERSKIEKARQKSEVEIANSKRQDDDREELDEVSDSEVDPIAALGTGSTLGVWLAAVRHCSSRRTVPADNIPNDAHPAHATVLSRKLKVLTPQLISLHTSTALAPQPQTRLGGTGVAMGDAQAQMKPPSFSSFLSAAGNVTVTQYSDLEHTPPNAFDFDSERFITLLSDKGEEVEEIFLEGCTCLSARALAAIGRYCVNLKLLNLQDCSQLTDEVLTTIVETCSHLMYLNISGCKQISGQPLASLFSRCRELHTLCMSGLDIVDEEAELAFAQMYCVPNLVNLNVSYCANLTNAVVVCAAQYCRGLEMLDISGCKKMTDTAVASIGMSFAHLRYLRLRLCSQLTLQGLQRLCIAPRNLQVLDLGGLTQLTPAGLESIVKAAPRLRELSISGCEQLDDTAIGWVTRYCKALQRFDISSCHGVSMASCMELVHELVNLRWLIVSESSISNAEVVMLSALRESCRIVRNQYRPQPKPTLIAYKTIEKKKKVTVDAKGGKKK